MACTSPCQTCNENATVCTSCVNGYQLNEQTQTCSPCTKGCLYCNNVLGCLVCQPGFLKIRNSTATVESYYCVACPANCNTCEYDSYSSSTRCLSCYAGFKVLTTGNCYACGSTPATQGCQVCTEVMTCQTCIPGLVLNSTHQCTAESID